MNEFNRLKRKHWQKVVLFFLCSVSVAEAAPGRLWSDSFSNEQSMAQLLRDLDSQEKQAEQLLDLFFVQSSAMQEASSKARENLDHLERMIISQEKLRPFVVRGDAADAESLGALADQGSYMSGITQQMNRLDRYLNTWQKLKYDARGGRLSEILPQRLVLKKIEKVSLTGAEHWVFSEPNKAKMSRASQLYVYSVREPQVSGVVLNEMVREVVYETIRLVETGAISASNANEVIVSLKNRLRWFVYSAHHVSTHFYEDDVLHTDLVVDLLVYPHGRVYPSHLQEIVRWLPFFEMATEYHPKTTYWYQSDFGSGTPCSKWLE